MSRHMTMRTTIRLPDDLIRDVKRLALSDGSTFTALVEEGLRNVLAQRRKKAKPPPIPVSSARGGFIDWKNIAAAVQEADDLEYIERLKSGFK